MKKTKDYYIGLDIGVGSVGLAVTDEEYNVIMAGRKPLMSVRLFDNAETAKTRRLKRADRRRLERRKFRIKLLQSLFMEEIMKIDPNFFIRLNSSDLHLVDRPDGIGKFSLFEDVGFTDKDYHIKYPTVYHLRKALINGKADDIRLIYLAVAHIIKYRGNFIYEGRELGEINDPKAIIDGINRAIENLNAERECDTIPYFSTENVAELAGIAATITKKKELLQKICDTLGVCDKTRKTMISSVVGMKFDLDKIYGDGCVTDDETLKKSYSFENYEQNESEFYDNLTDNEFALLLELKKFNDWLLFVRIGKNYSYISDAMIEIYLKHKCDLEILKRFINSYFSREEYAKMFGPIVNKECKNYSAYVSGGWHKGEKISVAGKETKQCTKDEFYNTIKVLIKEFENRGLSNSDCEYMKREMEDGEFMPKIVSKDNAAIPYQLHLKELREILEKAAEKFEFLRRNDERGISVTEKIISLLKFRIPYYIGPLNNKSEFAWLERKEGKIYPWNFNDMVNLYASEEKFIKRMTNKCSILKTADVLPKNSVIFSKYVALSELNKLKVNGEPINVELKKKVFDNVYLNPENKKVTVKKIQNEIIMATGCREVEITGYGDNIIGNMGSYLTFKKILGEKADKYPEMVENIIKYLTVHSDGKHVAERVRVEYGDILTSEEINKIKSLNYAGWGALSKELLDEVEITDYSDGQLRTTLGIMYETNLNLNEIVYDKRFNFSEACAEFLIGSEEKKKLTYDDVKELYCSPAVKRAVWQAVKMIKEVEKILGCPPKKVFIEVTRGSDGKKKAQTQKKRKDIILKLYKEAEKSSAEYKKYQVEFGVMSAKVSSEIDIRLRSDKFFLYYQQLGKCMYSGEDIDPDNLEAYDIDHIIPQSLKKDDSLDNRVLVKGVLNKDKKDEYPVPLKYRTRENCGFWKVLAKMGLISKEKLMRLMRVNPLTDEEKRAFINRQIVETGQSTKAVAELLKSYFNSCGAKTEIEYIKACNVSDFRKRFYLSKSRDINDFHHAYDAYLNIVVGNVLTEKFQHNFAYFDDSEESKNIEKVFDNNVWSRRGDKKLIWAGPTSKQVEPTIVRVKKNCSRTDISVTKMQVEDKGAFYDDTIYPKDKNLTPRISDGIKSDVEKYGGYKRLTSAYFVLVKSWEKNKHKISIEPVTVYHDSQIRKGKLTLEAYLKSIRKLEGVYLPYPDLKIKKYALLELSSKCLVRLTGYQGSQLVLQNANEFFAKDSVSIYMKAVDGILKKTDKFIYTYKGDERIKKANEYLDLFIEQDKKRLTDDNVSVKTKNHIIVISKEHNAEIYEYFIERLQSAPFVNLPAYENFIKALLELKDKFNQSDLFAQLLSLKEILKAFGCNAVKPSLKSIGGNSYCNSAITTNITGRKVKLINENILGTTRNAVVLSEGK